MTMKRFFPVVLFFVAAGFFFASCTPSEKYLKTKLASTGNEKNFIRVLIKIEDKPFKISSQEGLRVVDQSNGKIVHEAQKGILLFYPEKINKIYLISCNNKPLYLNESPYRGDFEVRNILGKIYIINIVNIEDYLCSVVPSEMPAGWNIEALKAQAIVSRTYTYYHLFKNSSSKKEFDLDATTNFQVYKGISVEKDSTTKAVKETAGLILTYNSEPILAYFHSTSGGKTADDKYVFSGEDLPYLEGVPCTYSKDSPHYQWTIELSLKEIEEALRKKYQRMGKISKISFKKFDDRVIAVEIVHSNGTINLTGNQFRLLISPERLRSTFFTAEKKGNVFYIQGRGWGHGVGMCQWGAKGRAEHGFSYEKILTYYYKDVKLTRINNNYLAHKRGSGNLVN